MEVIRDLDRLRAIAAEWRALAEPAGNVFLTPDWFFAWWRHYGDGQEPSVVVTRDTAGALTGMLPLARRRRRLRFAGANLADHLHPLAASPAGAVEVAAAAGAILGSDLPDWRMIVLDNVEAGAPWVRAFRDRASVRLAAATWRETDVHYVSLPSTWESYLATRSRNLRSELGRKLRRLEREHEVGFRRTASSDELEADLTTFFALHDARWDPRGGSSSRSARARAFHADFGASALARGWLRLWFMDVDGQSVAAWYGWHVGRRYLYYLAGFDPKWSPLSVGLLLMAQTVRAAIDEGASEYDMLLGEEPYKLRFANQRRSEETLALARAGHPASLLAGAEAAMRAGYTWLPRPIRSRTRFAARHLGSVLPGARNR